MRIRPAEPRDLPAAARLAGELVRAHHRFDQRRFMLPPDVEHGYERFFASQLGDRDAVLLVAEGEADGRIAGYVYGRIEGRNWALLLDRHGELIDLYVDEPARRQGIGRALLQQALAVLEAKGAPRIVLSAAVANTGAQALFRDLGFRPTMLEMTRERGSDVPGV